jgi:hydroxymethylglutaryl-CoA reductase
MFQNWVVFVQNKAKFFSDTESITKNMQKSGVLDIVLNDKTNLLPNYYQLHATFETKDSMGLILLIPA